MYQHSKNIITAGVPVENAKSALVMIHGRGASAQSIISLSSHLDLKDVAICAPQATNHSWYPTSFIAPVEENQPALDSALEIIGELVEDIIKAGIPEEKIYFLGFSQGACLTLEYVTRNAMKYGGVIAFTGGLIGEELNLENYKGDFAETTILITTGDPDAHVPVRRVRESAAIQEKMNGKMHVVVYPGRPHTITNEEIAIAKDLFFKI
ncbi:dienelactone hydrolase family protein [Pedobacter sp. MC2016-15]|uniref:alpha/beta hydrolase n=1 Tax=Pedobacter sp. MC2016-15 TaxID=2994473 RepID=UPI002247AC96|nr:dienelactone hydrolase family protein [Pedobacter sp. MC2016-15]MCX2480786.1 dienelactone hydrolase family protein [Pedobacter sp. MC2016-15]